LVQQRRKTEEDEINMRNFMREGDLLVAEIKSVSYAEKMIGLHIRNERFGRLGRGYLVEVNNCLVRKTKSQFVEHKGVQFIFGMNGFVWLAPASGELGADYLEVAAKFRNLLLLLNESFVSIGPDFLFEVNGALGEYRARDLLVPENREKILEKVRGISRNKGSKI
jgi:exosome complex RNA-binding protein Rrp4